MGISVRKAPHALAWMLVVASIAACSSSSSPTAQSAAPHGCARDETTLDDGSCQPPGVPPGACDPGFMADGNGGCDAILPAGCPDGQMAVPGDTACTPVGVAEPPACPAGQLALPGETACRDVSPCGAAPWGSIPVDSTTKYVDASYAANDSDGSPQKPWKTIAAGVTAAASGAIVAIAAGSYHESVAVTSKPVKLWGRCPSLVEIVTTSMQPALGTSGAAAGTELHQLALTGGVGVRALGALRVDHVWMHGLSDAAIEAHADLTVDASLVESVAGDGIFAYGGHAIVRGTLVRGTTQPPNIGQAVPGIAAAPGVLLEVHGSVVERTNGVGIGAYGADLTVDGTVIRDTIALPNGTFGDGLDFYPMGKRHVLTVTGSLVARAVDAGMVIFNPANATITNTRITDTRPQPADRRWGHGIDVQPDIDRIGAPAAVVTVRRSLIEKTRATGLYVVSAEAHVEASVVRDTTAEEARMVDGVGIGADDLQTATGQSGAPGCKVSIRGSLLERNTFAGLGVESCDAEVDGTVIRKTAQLPNVVDNTGYGIEVGMASPKGHPTTLALRGSLIDANHTLGVAIASAVVTMERTTVRGTLPSSNGTSGLGIEVVRNIDTVASSLAMTSCSVQNNAVGGIVVSYDLATIEDTDIRGTNALPDGTYGDGISAFSGATLTLTRTRVQKNARAGVSMFGASATLVDCTSQCNAIALDGETDAHGDAYAFDLSGGAQCGCNGKTDVCQVLSSALAAPSPVQPGKVVGGVH